MANFAVELKGGIYFFYRPKVAHEEVHSLDDVQRFLVVLKPEGLERYSTLIVGKKHLPKDQEGYFAFVDGVADSIDTLVKSLGEELYATATRGARKLPEVRCIGEGKFMIIRHENHTHLMYQLAKPTKIGQVQQAFNLALKDDFIITVKNPNKPSPPHAGLSSHQKAAFSKELAAKFDDYRFIPLIPADFIDYEGAEILLLSKAASRLEEDKASRCLEEIQEKDILPTLEAIIDTQSIAPIIDRRWV